MTDGSPLDASQRLPKTGTVRSRASPPSKAGEQNAEGRPPTKRARKAINCEPCRNSKLKCDRNRPCSSCVLRGTSALCYQDGRAHEGDNMVRREDINRTSIDPAQEIARLRHSISLLEAHIFPHQRNNLLLQSGLATSFPKTEMADSGFIEKDAAPGMLGSPGQGGLYAGPTSAATHLLLNDSRDSEDTSERRSQSAEEPYTTRGEYDQDLFSEHLPKVPIIDSLIEFYFEYCNWIYRHVNQPAFMQAWGRYKAGYHGDRIVLATACVVMAVAVYYLPEQHQLFETLSGSREELGQRYYDVMRTVLQRHQTQSKIYSLELVELLLIRSHYLTLWKAEPEEIWAIRGELLSIGTAMGLHRDPGKWKMHRDVAERRRWAWWHIILFERWQAFLFGRPIGIASNHFDTQLPSRCSPEVDKTGRLYLPNISLFKLAYILGDILNNAVSVRPVRYDAIQDSDRALTQWMDSLPSELDLDEFRIARNLASTDISVRRIGVQSVIIRTAYYHIRFTLHRPFCSKSDNHETTTQSLEIAVSAADKLVTMVCQARPDFLANSSLAVPGHMNWQPFHCFSAAMFFSFQLINNPGQPGAGLFLANIRKALGTIEQSRGTSVGDKSWNILQSLAPLYSTDCSDESPEERQRKKIATINVVKKLAFPYHDAPTYPRPLSDSPSGRLGFSPVASSSSMSPGMSMIEAPPALQQPLSQSQQHNNNLPPMSSLQTVSSASQQQLPPLATYTHPPPQPPSHLPLPLPSHNQQTPNSATPAAASSSSTYSSRAYSLPIPPQQQPHVYSDSSNYTSYVHPANDQMWGANMGFAQSEWSQFLDAMRLETISNR